MDVSGSELSHVIPVAVLEVALSKSSWQAVQFLSPPRHLFRLHRAFMETQISEDLFEQPQKV